MAIQFTTSLSTTFLNNTSVTLAKLSGDPLLGKWIVLRLKLQHQPRSCTEVEMDGKWKAALFLPIVDL